MRIILIALFSISSLQWVHGQEVSKHKFLAKGNFRLAIPIKNKSFEKVNYSPSTQGDKIGKWKSCGADIESPPTIQTRDYKYFQATTEPVDRNKYINMVTREDKTWESISQRLRKPLEPGMEYHFALYACISPDFQAAIRSRGESVILAFDNPVVLRVYGGKKNCTSWSLLAETPPIYHSEWKEYTFSFIPPEEYKFLALEAFYIPSTTTAYNGNVNIDYLSDIYVRDYID